MKHTKPASPAHSLSLLNDNMQTDILRSLHEKIEPRLQKSKHSSRLVALIASLEETIAFFEDFPELVLSPNPFCTDPAFPFDEREAYKTDLNLMRFQLKELQKISAEISGQ